ncbi:MAG: Uma2 family endonuclease [Bryobacterales bacterium]|nr:Uma2 family endonuclease [Bryobacterales bacterium]
MPVALEAPVTVTAPPHKLWTRAECEALERAGVLEMERYELVGGELVLKLGKNKPHMLVPALLLHWLQGIFGALFVLQDPTIDIHPTDSSTNEPQPDVVVMNRSIRELPGRPEAKDIVLAAEVSATTLSFDLTVKARLYARAAIAEYWVVDLTGRQVIVHRQPEDGRYMEVVAYAEEESVATLGAPEVLVRVGDLF